MSAEPVGTRAWTYLSGQIVKDIRLQWHVHVDCPSDPAEFALSHIEHSLYATSALFGDLSLSTYAVDDILTSDELLTLNPSHASIPTSSTTGFSFASRKKYKSAYCCW